MKSLVSPKTIFEGTLGMLQYGNHKKSTENQEEGFEFSSNLLCTLFLIQVPGHLLPFCLPAFVQRVLLDFIRFSVCFEVKYLLVRGTHRGGSGASWTMLQIKDSSTKLELTASKQPKNNNFLKFLIEAFFVEEMLAFSSPFDLSLFLAFISHNW